MKLYKTQFNGYVIYGNAVVLAENRERAFALLKERLNEEKSNLKIIGSNLTSPDQLEEIDLTEEKAVILFDGDF